MADNTMIEWSDATWNVINGDYPPVVRGVA